MLRRAVFMSRSWKKRITTNIMEDNNNNDFRDYWKQLNEDQEPDTGQEQYWNGMDDRGFRRHNDPNYGPIPEEYQSNAMSQAAFTCGIVSIVAIFFSFIFVGGSFIVGAMGILFALLSRKNKFNRQAKTAMGMCVTGMAVFVLMFAISFGFIWSTGLWGMIMEKAAQVDPNDPTSVTVMQQEIMEELMKRYGVTQEGTDSAGAAAAGTADSAGTDSAGDAAASTADSAGTDSAGAAADNSSDGAVTDSASDAADGLADSAGTNSAGDAAAGTADSAVTDSASDAADGLADSAGTNSAGDAAAGTAEGADTDSSGAGLTTLGAAPADNTI